MFEVLVRKALVGGSWRDGCPEYNIDPDDIEADAKRRRDALKPDAL